MEPSISDAETIYRRHWMEQQNARGAALERLRLAVKAGDVHAMESAYTGPGGFHIGLEGVKNNPEYLVLLETIMNDAVPLEVLGVFFRKLGGRYALGDGKCVYTVLMDVGRMIFRYAAEEEAKFSARMNAVVQYLVEELGFPIRTSVIVDAKSTRHAACYFAFAKFVKAPVSDAAFLDLIVQGERYCPAQQYWVEKLGIKLGEEALLGAIESAFNFQKERVQKRIDHAISHIRETQKKLDLMLTGQRHENEALRRVMGNENLALMICGMAFEKTTAYDLH